MSRSRDRDTIIYRSERSSRDRAGVAVRYRTGEEQGIAPSGSIEEFLIERYALHTVDRGRRGTVRVRHQPYPLLPVEVELLSETLLAAARVPRPETAPVAHFSSGVDVEVRATLSVPVR